MSAKDPIPEGCFARIMLRKPIQRGDNQIKAILLREPDGRTLMDVELFDLMRMNTTQIRKLLPRISEPSLIDDEVGLMGGPDLFEVGQEISAFLLL